MSFFKSFLLAMSGSVLLLSGVESSLSLPLMMVAYVPVLLAEDRLAGLAVSHRRWKVWVVAFGFFFLSDVLALYPFAKLLSYWIFLYAFFSAVCVSVVFLLFSVVKERVGHAWGAVAWVTFMVAAEYVSQNTVFAFPCMLAGVLAFSSGHMALAQWYEYTGVLGGSLWVFACNWLLFAVLRRWMAVRDMRALLRPLVIWLACVVLPVFLSLMLYVRYEEQSDPVQALVVQPNIDPYTEKFSDAPAEQLAAMLRQARAEMTEATRYVLLPETALQGNLWYNNIDSSEVVRNIRDSLLADYPQTKLIAGADMMQYYVTRPGAKPPTPTAKRADDRVYYDFFNVALQVGLHDSVQVYRKSKLVLGTEYVPFVQRFPQLENLVMELGGSAQSRGRQERPSLLRAETAEVAPVICFESLFGEYVSEFVQMGAELICILSNDGWWDEHPIPVRHVRFAQLRAIENRRSVMRCANTGISCFIDQRGDLREVSGWWTKTCVTGSVNKNGELTFYTRHGDYVGRWSMAASFLLLLMAVVKRRKRAEN